jgi:hypothetical protein
MGSDTAARGTLAVADLYSLEQYHRARADFRARVLAHKRERQIAVGQNATLYFEDRLTIQYQVQEMLRIERIFETEAISEELAAYNPLIPTGRNLKATFMLEFPDADERRRRLAVLGGIETCLFARVDAGDRIACIADEDLERTSDDKTAAVHFVRFEFTVQQIAALRSGAKLEFLIDHPHYRHVARLSSSQQAALVADFD